MNDQSYLLSQQYKTSSNLDARAALHERFSTNTQGWQQWVFDQIALPVSARLLELGCGPGLFWQANASRIPTGWQVTLSDFSPGMVEAAQHNLSQIAHSFEYRTLDAQAIPFDDGAFDAVIANHMLYHVPDLPKALAEIRRVLRPGCTLYAATNGNAHMQELASLATSFAPAASASFAYMRMLSFRLENGEALLTPYFASVSLRRYEDALLVTDADPLVAYIQSMQVGLTADDDSMDALQLEVEQTLKSNGAIHIRKDTGLFVATRE